MIEPEYIFRRLDWCQSYSNQKFLPGQTVPHNMPKSIVDAWLESGTIELKNKPVKVEPVKVEPEPEPELIQVRQVTPKGDPLPEPQPVKPTSAAPKRRRTRSK